MELCRQRRRLRQQRAGVLHDRKDNVKIEDGELVITGIKGKYKGKPYTSAKLTTEGKFTIRYGRIEACIKSPKPQKERGPLSG